MAEAKILIAGYTTADTKAEGQEKTCPTISLVRAGEWNIIVDPGTTDSQQVIIDALQKENLSLSDINLVFITHSHLDHYRNIGMFPAAKTLEYWGLWTAGEAIDWEEQFTEDIRIIKTPGHNYDGLTMLVKTAAGTVAICGDVFWKEDFPVHDDYASDQAELGKSRQKVLAVADWVIPGHGGMYSVKKN